MFPVNIPGLADGGKKDDDARVDSVMLKAYNEEFEKRILMDERQSNKFPMHQVEA